MPDYTYNIARVFVLRKRVLCLFQCVVRAYTTKRKMTKLDFLHGFNISACSNILDRDGFSFIIKKVYLLVKNGVPSHLIFIKCTWVIL